MPSSSFLPRGLGAAISSAFRPSGPGQVRPPPRRRNPPSHPPLPSPELVCGTRLVLLFSLPPSSLCGPRLGAPVGLACGRCPRGARRESLRQRRGEPSAQAHGGGGGGWMRGGERAGATGSGSPPAHSHMLPSRSQLERRFLPSRRR